MDKAVNKRAPVVRQVPAVMRAIRILRYLAKNPEPIGVNQLANSLDIVPSTCLHILRVMTEEGLVAVDPRTKHYRIGIGILSLARAVLSQYELSRAVQPALDKIARRNGVTAVFIERSDRKHLIVAGVAEGPDMFSVKITVGSSFPAFGSASGRCIAAYSGLDRSEIKREFSALRWQDPPSFSTWLEEVEMVPQNKYAIDKGNFIRGVTVIAAPIVSPSAEVDHLVTCVAVQEQLTETRIEQLIAEVVAGAADIKRVLT